MPRRGEKLPSQRQLRVGEEIRHLLAGVLGRGELRDPQLVDRVVTVTEVRVAPDLKHATAFVVPLGGLHEAEVVAALRRCAPYLRGVVARNLVLRHAPQLGFELDRSFDRARRIEELLRRPEIQRDLAAPDADGNAAGEPPEPHGR